MRNHQRIKANHMAKGRLAFILFVLFAAFFALIGRVTYLKVVYGEEYETAARTQQISGYDDTINPNRGTITDRNHQPLAVSTTVYNIVLDVRVLVQNKMEEQEKTLHALCEAIPDLDYDTLKGYTALVDEEKKIPVLDTSWKVLAKQQSVEVKEALEAQDLKGVVYQKDTKRSYPAGKLAASVIGFERGDARLGLEEEYNQQMTGIPGRSYITYDGANGAVSQEVPAQDGNTIITTLDYNMQTFAEQAVEEMMADYNPENAASIIMDPNTGEILAMAAGPGFDPNNPTEPLALDSEAFAQMWAEMDTDAQYEYLNGVWNNFNISSTFEPGSIFKPITVAAALEEGIIQNTDTFYCSGSKQVADYTIGCHLRSGHGTLDVAGALAQSCNVALMDIAEKMGAEIFYRYQRDFGFGSKTGVDLPGEVSASSLMYDLEQIGPTELATMSFGQSFNATALQCLNAFAAVINGGNLMRPYIVSQVVDPEGTVLSETQPEVIRKVISEETSDIVREDMIQTLEVGTGKKAKIEGYVIGGKTGTAEQGRTEPRKYTVSFISYLPADHPQYLVMTLIHKPESYADGITTVAPAMKTLLEKIIQYKGIEPSYEADGAAATEETTVTVNDYTGATLFDVLMELDVAGLSYEVVGTGNQIVNQAPHGPVEVKEGSQVILYVQQGEGESGGKPVPDVRGMTWEDAVTTLTDASFVAQQAGEETEGVVLSMSPQYGVTLEEGSTITLTMGTAEEEETTTGEEDATSQETSSDAGTTQTISQSTSAQSESSG